MILGEDFELLHVVLDELVDVNLLLDQKLSDLVILFDKLTLIFTEARYLGLIVLSFLFFALFTRSNGRCSN